MARTSHGLTTQQASRQAAVSPAGAEQLANAFASAVAFILPPAGWQQQQQQQHDVNNVLHLVYANLAAAGAAIAVGGGLP